jgi:hypothetical protein
LASANLSSKPFGKRNFLLNEAALQIMSIEWITKLHQAAVCADEEVIFQLLNQIPEANANLSNALTDLVNNFCLDQIINLTEKVAE